MIGFYDYTVILTFLSLLSAVMGMMLTVTGHPILATMCLLFCGLCDMFDGKVARSKKNRSAEEKSFGIQIDSLTDIVAFGVLPAMIMLFLCGYRWYAYIIAAFYVLAGLIRLAYFNVTEEQRQKDTDECRKSYSGLPITSAALIFPIFYCVISAGCVWLDRIERFGELFSVLPFRITLCAITAITGLFFILPIKIRKPQSKELWAFFAVGVLVAFVLLLVMINAQIKAR
ncbi:MAG: CDP-alcohol phosphatidyltransferase family protein [Faecousia sp.]